LPLGWAAMAHPFRAADPEAVPGPEWTGCSSATKEEGVAATVLAVTLLRAGPTRTIMQTDQTAAIVRLGRFSVPAT
jgi:hypothetical protein